MSPQFLADVTPLRNRDYRRLWTAGVVTVIGAQLSIVAVPVQIYQITQSSAYVGLAGIFALVPLIVFGLWGGALADVMDRRLLMIIATSGLVVTATAFWVQAALGLNNVWLILCLLAIQQGFFAVNQPTRAAIIPRLLPGHQLPAANALNMMVFNFGAIAGPLMAGAMIPLIGLSTLYLLDAIALLATLWAAIKLPPLPPTGVSRRAGFKQVFEGFAFLATQRILLASFVVDIIAMVAGMPRALFPQIAHETFGDPVTGGLVLGMLFASISAGAVLGGVFSGWLSRVERQGAAVIICILVWGVAMTGFGVIIWLAPLGGAQLFLWLALGFLALGGAADMFSAALRSTMLQQIASDEMRGRLQGVFIVVVAGGPRIGDALHGAAAAMVGTAAAAAGGGVLVIIGIVVAVFAFPAFVRYKVSRS
ncbi:MFS transporter [Hoyosella rhizosphaerae]|uniref:MFS transporter n=1 Tax=Hoyosella rhizosphaerae TaxID=1755582 RepID=A0A916XD51_9ACTN|nr:MFS transporter [Hoyosella rhizosphaerae]MBN4926147.1 MFS transporter [Hoyosella rhizosphaerae]GGC65174.1 MFS transporter [Hoyosella rhizosphaerae]